MKFDRIDWGRVFFKTYYEKWSFGHLFVNFNRIFVIHIAVYYFYTAYNSPNVYKVQGRNSPAMTWSATALGGAIATIIMIIATLFEFSYIPTTWNNTSHLARRLLFLLVTLGLTCGPTFYIAIVESNGTGGSLSLILGIVQFFISAIATLLFAIVPSGRMFGDRVRGKSRKYLASQTFTASYHPLDKKTRMVSILLWVLIFGCKFTESYFFLTQSFSYPIQVMVGMKIQGCSDRFFGKALCTNQAAFTLAIMYIMDLILFFLDTFLWYIIWNTVFSICRSFMLGLSIWTPWKDIYARLPKRIYAKLLASQDMEVKYKPKVSIFLIPNLSTVFLSPSLCRSSSHRSGTRSSFPCTMNTCCPSTMFRSCSTTKLTPVPAAGGVSVHLRSSCPKVANLRESSFLLVARLNAESRSLHKA